MGNHRVNPFAHGNIIGGPGPAPLQTQLIDAFGRELGLGDMVVAPAAPTPVLRIVSLKPDLRPHGGPPQVIVTVQMTQQMTLPAGVPQAVFLQVLASPPKPDGEPPPADPPPPPDSGHE